LKVEDEANFERDNCVDANSRKTCEHHGLGVERN